MNEAVKNQSNRVMTTTFDEKEKKTCKFIDLGVTL